MLRFDSLHTPAGDGDILIEPSCDTWGDLLNTNRSRRAREAITLAGQPLDHVRDATRLELFGRSYADGPVIAAGHQPEFIHPGVWAKQVVVHRAADRLGAATLDLVVDNDVPRSTGLRIPVIGPTELVTTRDLPVLGGPAGAAYEGQPPLPPTAVLHLHRELTAALGSRCEDSMLNDYLGGLRGPASTPPSAAVDFVQQHLAGRRQIDALLNADLRQARVSEVCCGPVVADLLLEADRFAAAYNESLAEYRHDQQVRSPNRPLPDLQRDGDRIEACFWIYRPRRPRTRLWIERTSDKLTLFAGQEPVATVGADDVARDCRGVLVSLAPWAIRPRALALTFWARLLVCDLFVHGIGGAKYDRITDGIFRRYHRLEPPAFACVSATLRLPLPRHPTTPSEVVASRHRLRDLRFNPDRYLASPPADLLTQRSDLIRQSRRLREAGASQAQRREVFLAIRQVNERLLGEEPHLATAFSDQLDAAARHVQSNRMTENREYFYALQPRRRLENLAARLTEAVGHGTQRT